MKKNWHTRIAEARERGEFTSVDKLLSSDWMTCACGEQDKGIERDSSGLPVDEELSGLGADFYVYVGNDEVDSAERMLAAIERRSFELINKITHWKSNRA